MVMGKNTLVIFLLSIGLFPSLLQAQMRTRYMNDSCLTANQMKNEKLQLVLCDIDETYGHYYITNKTLAEKNGSVSVGKGNESVNFTLIPAAKIAYPQQGKPGIVRDRYLGADGTERPAPIGNWNRFGFVGWYRIDSIQLYYLQKEAVNGPEKTKTFLTSISGRKLGFRPAFTAGPDEMKPFSQMFAFQEQHGGNIFQSPFYGVLLVAPVVVYNGNDSEKGTVNYGIGYDDMSSSALLLNVRVNERGDSIAGITSPARRETREFVLIKSNAIRVKSLALSKKDASLSIDNFEKNRIMLAANISPNNADNKGLIWKSLDESIAVVSGKGEVHGVKSGNTYITVTSIDGGISDSCLIKVFSSSGNSVVDNTIPSVCYYENKINIQSNRKELIQIYSFTGKLLYSGNIVEGITTIDAVGFPKVFVVKGSSGWVRKIAKMITNR